MTSFPAVIDSTMVNDFRRCPTRWAERYIHRLDVPGQSVDLFFGSCFAKGIEVTRRKHYIDNLPQDLAVSEGIQAAVHMWGEFQEPQGHAKNCKTLILALSGYFEKWPLNLPPHPVMNGGGIEYGFGIPLLGHRHPDTGEEIIYGGRFDMLGGDGQLIYPVDEKTTGSPFFRWKDGWNLWGQFIGYQWACRMRGYDVSQLLVRGIYVQKTKVDYIQTFTSATEAVTARWLVDLESTVDDMCRMYRQQRFPRVYGTACKVYSPCPYLPLCEATRREDWLTMYVPAEEWNPLAKPGGEL